MPCIHIPGGVVTISTTYVMVAGGKSWAFDWHDYCGPEVVNKRTGSPLKNQPGPRSPFWKWLDLWIEQGKRVDAAGNCVVIERPKGKAAKVGRNCFPMVGVSWDAGAAAYVKREFALPEFLQGIPYEVVETEAKF